MNRLVSALALTVLLGCTEATPPERVERYSFTIDCAVPDVCSTAADSSLRLIFRWESDALPVRVWVQPVADLPVIVRRGIDAWERASLYGEFRAVMVSDPDLADVIVRLGEPETATGGSGLTTLDCRGITEIEIDLDTAIVLPFRTTIAPRLGASDLEVQNCYHTVAMHELGHAFGLLLHSDAETDLMHQRPTVPEPSARDIATFVALYHTAPTVRLPEGR